VPVRCGAKHWGATPSVRSAILAGVGSANQSQYRNHEFCWNQEVTNIRVHRARIAPNKPPATY
jgi:hypothetical protein